LLLGSRSTHAQLDIYARLRVTTYSHFAHDLAAPKLLRHNRTRLSCLWHPDINAGGDIERRWHDPNDGKGLSIQSHGSADDSWVPAKSLLPETVTEHYNLLPARAVFLRKETTAEQNRRFCSLKKDGSN